MAKKLSKISGFPEWLPEQKLFENQIVERITRLYESYGFTPIETPAVELLSSLGAKGSVDKEIYTVKRLHASDDDEAELGLHFDLTVPFARYVAQHSNSLVFPFKRYQLQKVWRGERPQKGRFREFYQFDIDIIGREELPLAADAEVLTLVGSVMEFLAFGPYQIRVNSRKLLKGLYGAIGLDEAQTKAAITAVDKLQKIGVSGVTAELERAGLPADVVERLITTTNVQTPIAEFEKPVRELALSSELIDAGIDEISTIAALLPDTVKSKVVFDLSMARGLDYYTGLIIETVMTDYPEFGTVMAGGRYENLASEFTDQKFPGVGVSIGLSRLMELVFDRNLVELTRKSPSRALVAIYDEAQRPNCLAVAAELRNGGVSTETFYKPVKLGKQLQYAEAKGMQYVFFVDPESGSIRVKDLVSKEQVDVESIAAWLQTVCES